MSQLHQLIIGAPFGNYFHYEGVTSTRGTFTAFARRTDQHRNAVCVEGQATKIKRVYDPRDESFWWLGMLWRALRTIRYKRELGGWVNRMGLRNPGINSLLRYGAHAPRPRRDYGAAIISIYGFKNRADDYAEWNYLLHRIEHAKPAAVELNFSCPNIGLGKSILPMVVEACVVAEMANRLLKGTGIQIIAKLPPIGTMAFAEAILTKYPQFIVHLCNTVPCPYGGLSGRKIQDFSLKAINDTRKMFPAAQIIGGGGITTVGDIDNYMQAGANHVSIASLLLNPLNWGKPRIFRDYLHDHWKPQYGGYQAF